MKVISTESSQILASRLAAAICCPLVDVKHTRFPDGELYLQRNEIDGETVVVGSVVDSDSLAQLILLLDACEGSRITLVVPYMGYARQDKQFHPGEPLSARAIARTIANGADSVLTVNIHDPGVLRHFPVPAEDISVAREIGGFLASMNLEDPLILAPDDGAEHFAAQVASVGAWDCDHLEKTRLSGTEVKMAPKVLPVEGRDVVITDDIISTGGTLATAATLLRSSGARSVTAVCVHGVLATGAFTHLASSGIRDIICTDTIERGCSRISAAPALARAVRL